MTPEQQQAAWQAAAKAGRAQFVRYKNADVDARIDIRLGAACQAGQPPVVSILVPTKDGMRGGYLPRLLKDIELQTFQQFELILVAGDTRQGRAINTAAALARADLLMTLDDDSRLGHTELFERVVAALQAHPEIGMAGVANVVPTDAPWLVRHYMMDMPRRHSLMVKEITDSDQAEHGCLGIRKSVFLQVGGEHELIPRGLDPYLRQQFRAAGYRVVVIPNAWIHHLPPSHIRPLIRMMWRNGTQAAYCNKLFPEFVIETPSYHGPLPRMQVPLWQRAFRYAGRIVLAIVTFRWLYLLFLLVYAVGFVWGWCTTPRSAR